MLYDDLCVVDVLPRHKVWMPGAAIASTNMQALLLDGVRALQHSPILGLLIVQPAIVILPAVVQGERWSSLASVSSDTD